LPIDNLAPRLVSALETHQVLLLTGGTGTGKTSRVPQFLLHAFLNRVRQHNQALQKNEAGKQNKAREPNEALQQNESQLQDDAQVQTEGVPQKQSMKYKQGLKKKQDRAKDQAREEGPGGSGSKDSLAGAEHVRGRSRAAGAAHGGALGTRGAAGGEDWVGMGGAAGRSRGAGEGSDGSPLSTISPESPPPPDECRVVVVQPRRISAIASAARVASEIGQATLFSLASAAGKNSRSRDASPSGSAAARAARTVPSALRHLRVGYSVRLEACPPSRYEHATVEFVTAGVMLRRLAADPKLGFVTHLIVDEAHERPAEVDLLLSELRASVLPARPELKVCTIMCLVLRPHPAPTLVSHSCTPPLLPHVLPCCRS
jgi:hypothetical protein